MAGLLEVFVCDYGAYFTYFYGARDGFYEDLGLMTSESEVLFCVYRFVCGILAIFVFIEDV